MRKLPRDALRSRASNMPPSKPPLIPEKFIEIPSQRLYVLSLAFLSQVSQQTRSQVFAHVQQAVKALDFVGFIASSDDTLALCKKWMLFDVAFCLALTRLRIPRLNYSRTMVLLQLLLVVLFDGLMFGGIRLNMGGGRRESGASSSSSAFLGSFLWNSP